MKKLATYILLLFGTHLQVQSQCHGRLSFLSGDYSCESYDEWVLVFEDNFNGSGIDYNIWRNDYPWGRTLICNNEVEYYSDGNNIEVGNGILKLIAKDESVYERAVPWMGDNEELFCDETSKGLNKRWFDYTSGMIYSKQQFIYGKFEIRCKIPSIKKLWPAFWLYGGCSQEIDVFEFMSDNDNPYYANRDISFTYHRKFNCDDENKRQCGYAKKFSNGWFTDMSKDYHTYSVEWDEHKLIWRIDGTEVWRVFKWQDLNGKEILKCGHIPTAYYTVDRIFPLEKPMSVIANLAVKPDPHSSFPAQMEIDYIRVYQKINSSKTINICSKDEIKGSTVAGKEIVVGGADCNLTINSGEYLDLIGKESITLNPGFSVEAGANFSAKTLQSSTLKSGVVNTNSFAPENSEAINIQENIKQSLTENQIEIFPNPTNGIVNVFLPQNHKYKSIKIYNLNGKIVSSTTINNDNLIAIELQKLGKGIYSVVIESEENIHIEKLIIQ